MTFSHITNLFLNNNQIETLPDEIGNLENLQVLALENNKIKALPDSICKLKKLKTLFLHKNKLTKLPNGLSQLKELQKLTLHTNGFVRLPAIFHFFTHLKEISLQWFSYLDPAKDRSVRAEGLGNEVIKKFKMLSRSTHERSLDSFDFDAFARRLSDLSVSLNMRNSKGETLLTLACTHGDVKFVEHLLKQGADPNISNRNLTTPLLIALKEQNIELTKVLLAHKPDLNIDIKSSGGYLHYAVLCENPNLVLLLLKNGADPGVQDGDGNTPLHIALSSFDKEAMKFGHICEYLMKYNAPANKKNNDQWAPIHLAARRDQILGIRWILEYNQKKKNQYETENLFNIDKKGGEKEWTALHLANNAGNVEVVQALIEENGDLFKRNGDNLVARQIRTGNLITHKYLLKSERNWIQNNLLKDQRRKELSASIAFTPRQTIEKINNKLLSTKKEDRIMTTNSPKKDPKYRQIFNTVPDDINNTISCTSIDVIHLSDDEESTNENSVNDKVQGSHCLNIERKSLMKTARVFRDDDEDILKRAETVAWFDNRRNSFSNTNAAFLDTYSGGFDNETNCFKGPKLIKIGSFVKTKPKALSLKDQVFEILEKDPRKNNIIREFECKTIIERKKRVSSMNRTLLEQIKATNYFRTLRDSRMRLPILISIIEDMMGSENAGNDSENPHRNLILKEVLYLISLSLSKRRANGGMENDFLGILKGLHLKEGRYSICKKELICIFKKLPQYYGNK